MGRKEEIEARLAAIRSEMEKDNADIDALTEEVRSLKEELRQIEADAEKRKKLREEVSSGDGVVIRDFVQDKPQKERYDTGSQEYRTAWLKNIAVDERGNRLLGGMTDGERRAFTFVTTNTGAVVPKDIANRIVELVRSQSPILDDASMTFFTRGFGVPRHKSIDAGDAKPVNEGTANDDEQDTFDLLNLVGVEIKKHVVLSRQMEIQSIEAFETWLVEHLAARIRVAKEKHVLTRLDNTTYGIAAGNKLTGTLNDAEILKIFSQIDQDGEKVVYANAKTVWTVIAALTDSEGRKLFIPNSMSDPLIAGRVYGAAVKPDANLADNVLYVGVPRSILCNDFDDLEVVSQQEPKTLNRIITAYSLFDAGLENPLAFVKYTQTPG